MYLLIPKRVASCGLTDLKFRNEPENRPVSVFHRLRIKNRHEINKFESFNEESQFQLIVKNIFSRTQKASCFFDFL
jgi:hypothetical protein